MNNVPQFPEEDIPSILSVFYQHGKRLTKKKDSETEIKINGRLARILIRDPLFRDGHLRLDYEAEYLKDNAAIDSDEGNYRFDFRITASCPHPETIFVIEAKRLNIISKDGQKRSNASEYVVKGMMRFTNRKYAQFMHKHSMLGYVFDSQIEDAIDSIKQVIDTKADELEVKSDFSKSDISCNAPIYSTKHRSHPNECEIFHLLLSVPTEA